MTCLAKVAPATLNPDLIPSTLQYQGLSCFLFVFICVLTLESTLLRASVVSSSLPQHLGQTALISEAQKLLSWAHGLPSVSACCLPYDAVMLGFPQLGFLESLQSQLPEVLPTRGMGIRKVGGKRDSPCFGVPPAAAQAPVPFYTGHRYCAKPLAV